MFGYLRLDELLVLSISIGIVRIHWRKRTLMLVVAVGLAVVGGMVATGSAASAAAAGPGRFSELPAIRAAPSRHAWGHPQGALGWSIRVGSGAKVRADNEPIYAKTTGFIV